MVRIGQQNKGKSLIFSLDKPPIEPGWFSSGGSCTYTDTCDYSTGDCYATEAECNASLASSSSSAASSSSSPSSSSSSSSLYYLTTVLNARDDLPGLYFVEAIGIQMVSYAQATLIFSYTELIGNFFSVNVYVDTNLVATINLSESYASQPLQFVYNSQTYSGTFPATNGDLNF